MEIREMKKYVNLDPFTTVEELTKDIKTSYIRQLQELRNEVIELKRINAQLREQLNRDTISRRLREKAE